MSNESMDLDNYDSLNTNQQNNAPVTPNEFGHMVTSIEEDYIELQNSKNALEKHKKESEQKIKELMLKAVEQEFMIREFKNQVETYHKSENFKNNEKELKKLQQDKENFESKYTKLKQKLKDKKSEIKSLEKRNNELEDEASNYQSALGVVTNIKMSDDDINHAVQLNEDILSLQDKIDSYVTTLVRNKVDVKIEEITKLLSLYGCQTRIETADRQFIGAILQRHVLETIFEFTKRYFVCSEKDYCYLESDVVKKTDELHELMKTFASTRCGADEITNVTPIKLRQLIYAALGMRGLGDIIKSDNLCIHDSIGEFSENLNSLMNQYRVVTDPSKKEYVDGLAKIIIQEVFRIFHFRLKIQEPIAQYHWFKCGDKVNKTSMDTSWDEDEIDDLVVELCTFPLIYQDINSNRKIFTPAKIFIRHVPTEKLQNESDNSDQAELTSNNSTEQAEQDVDESSHHSSTNILTDTEANQNYSQENKIQIVDEKQENEEKQQIETCNEGEIH